MQGKWMEVWAREEDDPEDGLVYKIPMKQWTPDLQVSIRHELETAGCTEIRFVEVDEG